MHPFLKKLVVLLASLIIFITILPIESNANASANVTRVVKVGYYYNENFQEGAGEGEVKSGYGYEYLQKVASITGWRYEYIYGSWADIYEAFLRGEIDVLAGLGYEDERADYMYFPDYPMGYESYYLYIKSDDDSITENIRTLNKKKIGAIEGQLANVMRKWIKERYLDSQIVVFDDFDLIYDALEKGEVDAFIGEGSAVASKEGIIPYEKICKVSIYLCVAKTQPEIFKELAVALEELDEHYPFYIDELLQKFASDSGADAQVSLSEAKWLSLHDNTIRIGYLDNFSPYSGTEDDGSASGVAVDMLNSALEKLIVNEPITVSYKAYASSSSMITALQNNEIDVLFPISNNTYFLEQNNMFKSEDVVTSSMNFVYRKNDKASKNKPVAINRNNQIQDDYIKNYYSNLEIKYYNSDEDCLRAVVAGDVSGTIIPGMRASILLSNDPFTELGFAELPYNTVACFGVSAYNIGVLTLIDRALDIVDREASLNYTFQYYRNESTYSLKEFVKRNIILIAILIASVISVNVLIVAITKFRHQKDKMYFEFAYKDSLTGLFNRRSMEEDTEYYASHLPEDFACISLDLNGLKKVNDNLGHAAGDELIKGVGKFVESCFGRYGKVYRIGGDEFMAYVKINRDQYLNAKTKLDDMCVNWKGEFDSQMRISTGVAYREEMGTDNITEIRKLADQRMYEAKAYYYKINNIDRREH